MADILRANQPFSVSLPNGVPVNVNTGDLWAADDPIVSGREALFGPVEVRQSSDYGRARMDVDTETADAAPGSRRAPVRRRSVDTPPPPKNGEDERPADAQPPALAKPLPKDDEAKSADTKPAGKAPAPKGGTSGA